MINNPHPSWKILLFFGIAITGILVASFFVFFQNKVNNLPTSLRKLDQTQTQSGPVRLINNNSQLSVSFFLAQPLKTQRIIDIINQSHDSKLEAYSSITFSIEDSIPEAAITESWATDNTTYPYSAVSAQIDGETIIIRSFVDPKIMVQYGWNSFMIQELLERNFISGLLQVIDPDLAVLDKNRTNIEQILLIEFEEPLFKVTLNE